MGNSIYTTKSICNGCDRRWRKGERWSSGLCSSCYRRLLRTTRLPAVKWSPKVMALVGRKEVMAMLAPSVRESVRTRQSWGGLSPGATVVLRENFVIAGAGTVATVASMSDGIFRLMVGSHEILAMRDQFKSDGG